MASEVSTADKENDPVMDIEGAKDTTNEADKELFSLESILSIASVLHELLVRIVWLTRVKL